MTFPRYVANLCVSAMEKILFIRKNNSNYYLKLHKYFKNKYYSTSPVSFSSATSHTTLKKSLGKNKENRGYLLLAFPTRFAILDSLVMTLQNLTPFTYNQWDYLCNRATYTILTFQSQPPL